MIRVVSLDQKSFGHFYNKAMPSQRSESLGVPMVYLPLQSVTLIPKPDVELTIENPDDVTFQKLSEMVIQKSRA